MRIQRLRVTRFRGIESLQLCPGAATVLIGPSNSGKSTVLEAIDVLLHPGTGRPRAVTELDYFGRDPNPGFEIEAVIGELPEDLVADCVDHLEGWRAANQELVVEPDGEGVEVVLRVRVTGTSDFDLNHTFAKPESDGARFSPRLRRRVGWLFDGRGREPARELAFYQGSVLDRLFAGVELDDAIEALRGALDEGAEQVNTDTAVMPVLEGLGWDLRGLGLLEEMKQPDFEVGAVSKRELLQALRLAMPSIGGVSVPVERQGRGAQRLLLVAVLLRLARGRHDAPIAAFDEPEQALEPLRQAQLVNLLREVTGDGGQLFLATHSPEVVRGFALDDLVLMADRPGDVQALARLSPPSKQGYERRLDGAVVRGLFAPVPLLVEGPGDRPVLQTFWQALSDADELMPMTHLGVEVINCEGAEKQPQMAALLREAGKPVVAWAEQDVPHTLARLRDDENCVALLVHDHEDGKQNLEQSLAAGATVSALVAALDALAADRGYTWARQFEELINMASDYPQERDMAAAARNLTEFFAAFEESQARTLIARVLAAKGVRPFEMKGARQARLVAEAIVATDGTPPIAYVTALRGLAGWLSDGRTPAHAEFVMTSTQQEDDATS